MCLYSTNCLVNYHFSVGITFYWLPFAETFTETQQSFKQAHTKACVLNNISLKTAPHDDTTEKYMDKIGESNKSKSGTQKQKHLSKTKVVEFLYSLSLPHTRSHAGGSARSHCCSERARTEARVKG